ncbi:AP2 domain-containing protein [Gordonibacter sp.]|uniref:AP2 domain-containing protein n=1 Tax=Gordonibacter sp. TaxID=1968902 RepID=UPI002FC945DC
MCGKRLDLLDATYGQLTVRCPVGTDNNGSVLWHCDCACGNTCVVPAGDLSSGRTVSCGCVRAETLDNPARYRERVYADGTKLDALRPIKLRYNNVSGVTGVTPYKDTGRWLAQIVLRGKRTRLGIFDTLEDAAEARRQAERELFDSAL